MGSCTIKMTFFPIRRNPRNVGMETISWSGNENRKLSERRSWRPMANKVDVIRLNLLAVDRYFGGLPVSSRGTAILMTLGLVGSRKVSSRGGAMKTTETPESARPSARAAAHHVPDFQILVTRQIRLPNLASAVLFLFFGSYCMIRSKW